MTARHELPRRGLLAASGIGISSLALPAATAAASGAFSPSGYALLATGGTVTDHTEDDTTYIVHTFDTAGTTTFTPLQPSLTVEYLIVAGGGGGGGGAGTWRGGGGGGAGGLLTGSVEVTTATAVTVGRGGRGGETINENDGGSEGYGAPGVDGEDSRLGALVATGGGGGGGNRRNSSDYDGRTGGSGGGGGGGTGGATFGGSATTGQGEDGGAGGGPGGGGGGAGGQGLMASLSGPAPGGVGLDLRISGVWTTYAEGGPGGPDNEEVGTASTARGSGGYGGKGNQLDPNALLPGGDGVDGIVIVRYALP